MKKLLGLLAVVALVAAGPTHAADTAAPTKQQGKMANCNKDATDKKGDERKAFMKECLSAKAATPATAATAATPATPTTQQSRMKTCNADAAGKKGDERKAFMKECLSNKK